MLKNTFIRKEYKEENVIIYIHFHGENAIRQIEVYPNIVIKLSETNPICGDLFLYDQNFSDIEWESEDFISRDEFELIWCQNQNTNG